jgi:hypothetical protein
MYYYNHNISKVKNVTKMLIFLSISYQLLFFYDRETLKQNRVTNPAKMPVSGLTRTLGVY